LAIVAAESWSEQARSRTAITVRIVVVMTKIRKR